jgi:Predicted membrane protein
MMATVRRHLLIGSLGMSLLAIGTVFAAVLGVIPRTMLPTAPGVVLAVIPHVNAVLSTTAIVTIVLGVRAIRRGAVRRHRRLMLITVVLFVAFLVLYLYKVILAGPVSFGGPPGVYERVYLPVLAVHIILAVVCIPFVVHALLLGLTHEVRELYQTRHQLVGRIGATLWLISFALGNVVYLLAYILY